MVKGVSTLEDVAKMAGVSKATASRILGVQPGQDVPFAAATQERVRSAAAKLEYRPSRLARGLSNSKSRIVGLVVPTINDSFFASITSFIETSLSRAGYSVILSVSYLDADTERAKVTDLLDWHVDGLIVAPSRETGDEDLFWRLWNNKVPFVLIDRTFLSSPFYSVTSDDYMGAMMAVEHLLSIGKKRIALAGGYVGMYTVRLRHAGYTEALLRHGIIPEPDLIVEVPPTESGGRLALSKLMDLPNPPDAVFCLSDPVAIGVMQACIDLDICIPHDIAITGYSCMEYTSVLKVPLTTVRQPREQMAQIAADMLLTCLEGEPPKETNVVLPVELVTRESTLGR